MKTAIIISGMPSKESHYNPEFPANSNAHWAPWLQRQLVLKDILAQTPEMPIPYNPVYEDWKRVLEYFPINENTILVGHSCGGGLILRYLSENNVKVGKVVLVAPWIDTEKELTTGMFDFELDSDLVSKTNGITLFSSTDDMDVVQQSIKEIVKKVKDINVVEFQNYGHFCINDMKTEKFPELLEECLK